MDLRANEEAQVYFRSERIFSSNCDWFIAVRGGSNKGPFHSREEAEFELGLFMSQLQRSEGTIQKVQKDLGDFCQQLTSLYGSQ